MYEMNECSTIFDKSPGSQFSFLITRTLIVTILLLLYLMYIVIRLIFLREIKNLKSENSALLQQKKLTHQKWQQEYSYVIGDHVVAVGFAICFSPYPLETVLSIVYFLIRLIYEVRLHKFDVNQKILKTALRIINLMLFLCSMVGLSRNQYDSELGVCRDRDYRSQ